MESNNTFSEGMKVLYDGKEPGIIKTLNDDGKTAFVVYHCNNDWDNYKQYTGILTNLYKLTPYE